MRWAQKCIASLYKAVKLTKYILDATKTLIELFLANKAKPLENGTL